ncbi:hypothetical protein PHMEG_00037444 [Phytophthora megakarya]|uniref:Uncharacterized protein n=1 Tax=Phytophthora megakarya TaxID=4795 RepID=A0A225UJE1_9STRA|nr:hypothetical protein PHMEG_00037444 [Phytophthora megakarya]
MGKKQRGVNTKVEAAKVKKTAVKAAKAEVKAAAEAAAESADWSKGSDIRTAQRHQNETRKRAEHDAKKAEKLKLLKREEHELEEDLRAIRKQKKMVKEVAKPWEEALKPVVKRNNRGSKKTSISKVIKATVCKNEELTEDEMAVIRERESELAALREAEMDDLRETEVASLREAEAARIARNPRRKAIKFENNFQTNRNREEEEPLEAHSLDAALDLLGVGGDKELERHPERRMKAAYKAFEHTMLLQVKEDYPGLKLSQYKLKLREMVRWH